MNTDHKILLVIAGPTAVGKTDLCINLAKKFNTAIISSDSRQFFREMNIGTAKPSANELQEVLHCLVDNLSIHQNYDVGDFEKDALNTLDLLFKENDLVIMTGGSGLYIDAVTDGLDDMPTVDPEIRIRLNAMFENEGISPLQQQLEELDREYFQIVDKKNPQRLIRALEICIGTGKPFSSFRVKRKADRFFKSVKIALYREREELYQRINDRMDTMISEGLFEECSRLFPYRDLNALQAVGYREVFDFFEGKYDREEAIRLLKRNSRRYAKRQLTWFQRDASYTWFHPSESGKLLQYINDQIGR